MKSWTHLTRSIRKNLTYRGRSRRKNRSGTSNNKLSDSLFLENLELQTEQNSILSQETEQNSAVRNYTLRASYLQNELEKVQHPLNFWSSIKHVSFKTANENENRKLDLTSWPTSDSIERVSGYTIGRMKRYSPFRYRRQRNVPKSSPRSKLSIRLQLKIRLKLLLTNHRESQFVPMTSKKHKLRSKYFRKSSQKKTSVFRRISSGSRISSESRFRSESRKPSISKERAPLTPAQLSYPFTQKGTILPIIKVGEEEFVF